jgi:hypothetical protein
VFDSVEANDLYTTRDVERVAPGAEFPIITSARRAPGVAEVEKWGGKVWISDEARDRNDNVLFTNQLRQLATRSSARSTRARSRSWRPCSRPTRRASSARSATGRR